MAHAPERPVTVHGVLCGSEVASGACHSPRLSWGMCMDEQSHAEKHGVSDR